MLNLGFSYGSYLLGDALVYFSYVFSGEGLIYFRSNLNF
jgi:hypothetical protein